MMLTGPKKAFSSLFIGMGLAIRRIGFNGASNRAFQFPFHRDGPCDEIDTELSGTHGAFQFPFHRDGPCDDGSG